MSEAMSLWSGLLWVTSCGRRHVTSCVRYDHCGTVIRRQQKAIHADYRRKWTSEWHRNALDLTGWGTNRQTDRQTYIVSVQRVCLYVCGVLIFTSVVQSDCCHLCLCVVWLWSMPPCHPVPIHCALRHCLLFRLLLLLHRLLRLHRSIAIHCKRC